MQRLASHADVLRGSSRVPMGQERVTNPLERLRGRLGKGGSTLKQKVKLIDYGEDDEGN